MFDPSRYEAEVLDPLRGVHGRLPEGVPTKRYAIDHLTEPELTPQGLHLHLEELRTYWRRQADAVGLRAQVCRMLLAADAEVVAEVGDRMEDPQFWLRRGGRPREEPALTEPVTPSGGVTPVDHGPNGSGIDPPPRVGPPSRVRAVRDADVVRVEWQAPVTATGPVRYLVERLRHAPGSLDDLPTGNGERARDHGQLVVETSDTAAIDRPGESDELWYSVRAAYADSGEPRWSRPTIVECQPAPDTGHRRGTPPQPLPTTDAALAPVAGFELRTLRAQGRTVRLRLRWQPQPGTEVHVRRGQPHSVPRWQAGTVIDAAEIERYGEEVTGREYGADGLQQLETDVPPGYFVYVPFAVRGGRAMVSRAVGHGSGQPPEGARLRVHGDRIGVLWIWPPGCNQVEVVWTGVPGGDLWTVTRADYNDAGGFWLPPPVDRGTLRLTAITAVPHGRESVRSDPVEVELTGRRPVVVRWTMARRLLQPRHRTVIVTVEAPLSRLAVSARYSQGLVMPINAATGQELYGRSDEALAPDTALTFSFTVPADLHHRRPYWIRCFFRADAPLIIVDPSVSDMKVT